LARLLIKRLQTQTGTIAIGKTVKGKLLNEKEPRPLHLWLDADACPQPIRAILFRLAERRQLSLTLVANSISKVPNSEFIRAIGVAHGADSADRKIVELMRPGDIVVTADIPLAAASVEAGGIAIGMRGELFDEASVKSRLASRNLMEHLRASGMETGGPKPHSQKDTQTFANQIDKLITRLLKTKSQKKKES